MDKLPINLDDMIAESPEKALILHINTPIEAVSKHGAHTLWAGNWEYRPNEEEFLRRVR